MYRLGSWQEDKARPLLIAFRDVEKKEAIMSDLKKLKKPIEKFKGVGISPDLPPKERDEIKRMLEAAKKAHVENETDSVENYRFLVVGRGPRRKVIKRTIRPPKHEILRQTVCKQIRCKTVLFIR